MRLLNNLLLAAAIVKTVVGNCNPLSASNCDPDPALATSFIEDFKEESKYFDVLQSKGLSYEDDGLKLSLKDRFDNPSIRSNFYIMFGKVEVVLKAASGQGIVSSFYLQSDDLDEIDIELFGGDDTQFQSNYFSKGDTTTYTRGGYHNTPGSPIDNYLTYTIDWSKDSLSWAVNGDVVRTLYPNDPQGYPQTPMQIFAGIWAGGDSSNPAGTIEWAGGATTYGPTYSMYIKSLVVTDYSTGSKYEYSDKSGSWESIDSIDGQINGRQQQADKDFSALTSGNEISEVTVSGSTSSSSSSSSSSSASSSSSSSSTSSTSPSSTSTSTSTSSSSSSSSAKASTSSSAKPTTSSSSTSSPTTSQKVTSTTSTEIVETTTAETSNTQAAAGPITVIGSSTVWWTPTQTVWWTPSQTGLAQTGATQATNADTQETAAATNAQTQGVPTTIRTSVSSTSSNVGASTSAPGVSGSLDSENSGSRFYPAFLIVLPAIAFLI
ncbi:probable glycosidase Crh1p [[Candida] jaroonii]|uniref:Probable glycosidase Crh1p n=1 Tax=[Candida] jaroonii TaxID=467808 RepID=A0ACA9YBF8_9ASCO|nr:probable glycosidase Crh1p [[Candida] jaroonii]